MIYPMFAMVLLIFAVAVINLYWRIAGVRNKEIRARYFKVFDAEGADIPKRIVTGSKNYANQFEFPLLFLIVSSLVLLLQQTNPAFLALAWLFVISRAVHAFIHLTYNHILHRMLVFQVGVLCVMAMWILLVIKLS